MSPPASRWVADNARCPPHTSTEPAQSMWDHSRNTHACIHHTHPHTSLVTPGRERETDLLSSNLVILDISGLAIEERVPDQHNNALKCHRPSVRQVYKTRNKALQCKTKEKEYGIRAYWLDSVCIRMYSHVISMP
jgi:hypothetical protein